MNCTKQVGWSDIEKTKAPGDAFVIATGLFGGEQQARDRRCVLQCHARYFGWVKDAEFEHVAVGTVGCVVAVVTFAGQNRVHNHARLVATVGNNFAQWRFDGFHDQLDACVLISVVALERANGLTCAQQCDAAASGNAFFNGLIEVKPGLRAARLQRGLFSVSFRLRSQRRL